MKSQHLEEHHYPIAASAAARIVNLIDPSLPKSEAFGRVLIIVLESMRLSAQELNDARFSPSEN
ncbi:hypothetical protein ACYOEI_10920 [Singulisphaera rosea]